MYLLYEKKSQHNQSFICFVDGMTDFHLPGNFQKDKNDALTMTSGCDP